MVQRGEKVSRRSVRKEEAREGGEDQREATLAQAKQHLGKIVATLTLCDCR